MSVTLLVKNEIMCYSTTRKWLSVPESGKAYVVYICSSSRNPISLADKKYGCYCNLRKFQHENFFCKQLLTFETPSTKTRR